MFSLPIGTAPTVYKHLRWAESGEGPELHSTHHGELVRGGGELGAGRYME